VIEMSEEKARSPDNDVKLSKKHQLFAEEYLVDLNATQAAIRSGYSAKTARQQGARLLSNANIQKYINDRLEQIKTERVADQQEVLEFFSKVMRGETKEKTLKYTSIGTQELVDVDVSMAQRQKAAENLGRYYTLFTDKVEVSTTISAKIDEINAYMNGR